MNKQELIDAVAAIAGGAKTLTGEALTPSSSLLLRQSLEERWCS